MAFKKPEPKPRASAAPPAPKKKDALVKTPPAGALAKNDLANMFEQNEGAGMEGMGRNDLAIPRITILQGLSPQCLKGDGAFIKGAEPGDFYNNVGNEVFAKGEEGFLFVPVAYRRANIEWIPKKQGGGFVKDHGSDDAIISQTTRNDDGQQMLDNGHEIVTSAEYFCIVLDNEGTNPRHAVISLAKTQLKKARKLNTVVSSLLVPRSSGVGKFNPPLFYSCFSATSVPESNDKGSWMGWNITRHCDTAELPEGADLAASAVQFRSNVVAGKVEVAAPAGEPGAGGSTEEDGDAL